MHPHAQASEISAGRLPARLDNVPFTRWTIKARVVIGSATFFDAFGAMYSAASASDSDASESHPSRSGLSASGLPPDAADEVLFTARKTRWREVVSSAYRGRT
jgi:hypothetical protein